jgi:sugar O-acyltransferase (sialic acid O-acetyltransferase NeuD family)
MTPLLVLGCGEFAIEVLDIAEAAGGFEPVGFVESLTPPPAGRRHGGLAVFWADDLPLAPDRCVLVAGIGHSIDRRTFVGEMQVRGYSFVSVVHPSAVISPRAAVHSGSIVHANAVVSSNAVIASHVIVNRGALVGHDARIGAFATIGPGANVAGGATIGVCAYLGIGAIVSDHLSVGKESVVGAGAVVTRPVPDNVLVAGVPARVLQTGVVGLPRESLI